MRSLLKILLISLVFAQGMALAADLNQKIKLDDAARSWTVHKGTPVYYTSQTAHYNVDNLIVSPLAYLDPTVMIKLSPRANYRLFSHLQGLETVKDGQRITDYLIFDEYDELSYKVSQGTGSDLKANVAALSDQGILALVDPVSAFIQFYQDGELIARSQLYETAGDYSLERNIRLQWVADRCYVLIERPSENGGVAAKVLFISIASDGSDQSTSVLPFTSLQQFVFQDKRFFASGYSYNFTKQEMEPLIVEISGRGRVLWTNENFGHELVVSEDGAYLAALSSHTSVELYNLNTEELSQVSFSDENKVSLGLTVKNNGDVAVIRVPTDYFVKRKTHFAEIYFSGAKKPVSVQLDPRFHKLFRLHSDGQRFFVGTTYEWLEISE